MWRAAYAAERSTFDESLAVGVDYDLSARKSGIAVGASYYELARRVDMQNVIVAYEVGQTVVCPFQTCLDTRYEDRAYVLLYTVGVNAVVMLCRYDDGVYAQGLACGIVVFDRHLTLGVGTQVGHELALAAYVGQFLENDMRQNERCGHQLASLVACISEHYTLVAGPLLLLLGAYDAAVDIGRLFVYGREYSA